jgi:hypothetical protein
VPGGTGAIRVGRAFVELLADDSKRVRGLKRASAKLKAFRESVRNMVLKLAGLGAAIATPVLGLRAGGMQDRIPNATERTAKGVEGLRQDVKNNRPAFV